MKKLLFVLLLCSNTLFAQQMIKSGIIYREHPYIGVIQTLGKLYGQVDPESMAQLYADTAHFYGIIRYKPDTGRMSRLQSTKPKTLAEAKKGWQDLIDDWDGVTMVLARKPVGYEYTDNSSFTIQSWWLLTMMNKKTKKLAQVEMVLFDDFNDAGKISREMEYYDPTPLILAMKP